MRNSINAALVAAIVATALLGGASSAFAGGSYYKGVSNKPLFLDRAPKARDAAPLLRAEGSSAARSTRGRK